MEHAFLIHCTRYLTVGGLLILVVPKHRLAVSARYLAAHYDRIRCWRFPDEEYEDFDQVILTGNRKPEPRENDQNEQEINGWAGCEPQEMETLLQELSYSPASVATGEQFNALFTIRQIDPRRAAREARRSGVWANTSIQDILWPTTTPKAQPLMPLRQGHMAMLVASGFLDNLCLEAGGTQILVKGKTVKRMERVASDPGEEIWQDRMYTTIRTLDLDTGRIQDIRTAGPEDGMNQKTG